LRPDRGADASGRDRPHEPPAPDPPAHFVSLYWRAFPERRDFEVLAESTASPKPLGSENVPERIMAANQSFDITTGGDPQEVDNSINQAMKEITQRYDFKGLKVAIEFRRAENKIVLSAPEEFKLKAMTEVLQQKMARRQVPLKNLHMGKVEPSGGGTVRQE